MNASSPEAKRTRFGPDIAAIFLRWSGLRAALHRGYWLVASLYLVVDARLSPLQLVLIGVAQGAVSLLFEIPTGVVADTISRKWSLVIFHILVGMSMVVTGLVTTFPALAATQILWWRDRTLAAEGTNVEPQSTQRSQGEKSRTRCPLRPLFQRIARWW